MRFFICVMIAVSSLTFTVAFAETKAQPIPKVAPNLTPAEKETIRKADEAWAKRGQGHKPSPALMRRMQSAYSDPEPEATPAPKAKETKPTQ